jgi:hypothetical protein
MSQVALAWINKRISSPIIGFSSVERIDEAIEVRGKTLTEEEEKYLEELYQPKAIAGHSWGASVGLILENFGAEALRKYKSEFNNVLAKIRNK